ncbi:uncharacterized protein EV420DRAFT_1691821 [Desarmillaria tabescens]|uniref:Uncharacterized protein n=1 Tax=Armillaria tabescens TaxID=1929756 RepID=A0AA39MGF2_ARMTA|nr:uncharacterized protein EV420DRAFT_1691821 [Desarmillaria tabescens]KAK0433382.1 hypothetical protein EV420DRAFT_1691821 [Desarmillaria tabescens]
MQLPKFRTNFICLTFLFPGESDVYDSIKSISPRDIATVGLPPLQEKAPINLKYRPLVEVDIRTEEQSIGFSCVNKELWCNDKGDNAQGDKLAPRRIPDELFRLSKRDYGHC